MEETRGYPPACGALYLNRAPPRVPRHVCPATCAPRALADGGRKLRVGGRAWGLCDDQRLGLAARFGLL